MHWVWHHLVWDTPWVCWGQLSPLCHLQISCAPPASSPVGRCVRQKRPWCSAVGKPLVHYQCCFAPNPKHSTIWASMKRTITIPNKTSPSLFFSGWTSLPVLLSPPLRGEQGDGEWRLKPVQCTLSLMLLPPHAVLLFQCGVPPTGDGPSWTSSVWTFPHQICHQNTLKCVSSVFPKLLVVIKRCSKYFETVLFVYNLCL